MHNIIFFAGIANIFLGVVALRYGKIGRSVYSFAVFCFLTGTWVIAEYLETIWVNNLLTRFTFGLSALAASSLLAWSYFYAMHGKEFKHKITIAYAIYVMGILVAYGTAFTSKVIASIWAAGFGNTLFAAGHWFCWWASSMLFFYLASIFLILRRYFTEDLEEKKRDACVICGLIAFVFFYVLVSVLLPWKGNTFLATFGAPSSLFFVIFTFFSIVKNQFLDIKLLFVQMLAIILIAITLMDVAYADNMGEFLFRWVFFVFVAVVSILLVHSVENEIRRKTELEIVNMRLVRLDQTKSEFVSLASHQLRTPLTSSNGFMSMIREGFYGEVPEYLKEPLERVDKANQRLLSLVEDMLNVSRIESGKMVFNLKKEDIVDVLRDVVEPFDLIAQKKGLGLKLVLPVKLPLVNIDKVKVSEAISNIVDNAIKYSQKGTVIVSAKQNGTFIKIVVQDTGIGIAKEDLANVFEKFSRGTNQNRLTSTGTGLGLYFGKKVIEANYGKIRVESDGPNKGTRFVVELPVA